MPTTTAAILNGRCCTPLLMRAVCGAAALWFVLACSGKAQAACGDYLLHAGATFARPTIESQAVRPVVAERGEVPLQPAPCQGPHCRNSSAPPGAPAAPSESRSVGEQAVLSFEPPPGREHPGSALPESNRTVRGGHPERIDRPPRAG